MAMVYYTSNSRWNALNPFTVNMTVKKGEEWKAIIEKMNRRLSNGTFAPIVKLDVREAKTGYRFVEFYSEDAQQCSFEYDVEPKSKEHEDGRDLVSIIPFDHASALHYEGEFSFV